MNITMTNEWPATLPLPYIDFVGAPRYATLVTPNDLKIRSRRARFLRSYKTLELSWNFTEAQFSTFRDFFEDDLGNGSAQFQIELRFPLTSELTAWAVRFTGGFNSVKLEGLRKVNATIDLVTPIIIE